MGFDREDWCSFLLAHIGNLVVFGGPPPTNPSVNVLFTNCTFRNPAADCLWADPSCFSQVAVRNCRFYFRDGTNGTYPFPRSITHPEMFLSTAYAPTPPAQAAPRAPPPIPASLLRSNRSLRAMRLSKARMNETFNCRELPF